MLWEWLRKKLEGALVPHEFVDCSHSWMPFDEEMSPQFHKVRSVIVGLLLAVQSSYQVQVDSESSEQ